MSPTISRTYSIKEIFEQTRDFDYLLTTDTPLADALNNRIDSPRLGKFAYTPRGLVYENLEPGRDPLDRRELFLKLHRETDFHWREAHYLLQNVLDCWQEKGQPEKILDYNQFANRKTKLVVEFLRNTDNIFRCQTNFDWEPNGPVVVVGHYQFNQLDRRLLPSVYETLDPLNAEGKFSVPEFNIFSSLENIARAVVDSLDKYRPTDVAVVVDSDSNYQALLEAAFQAEEIPYTTNRLLSDTEFFRTLLSLIEAAFNSENLRVREVRPLLKRLDYNLPPEYREEFISSLTVETLEPFVNLLEEIPELRFATVLSKFKQLIGLELPHLESLVEELELAPGRVTQARLNFLEFYANTFEPTLEEQNQAGVLLVSPSTSTYIDRPVVFSLGLGVNWSRELPPRPWINREQQQKQNINDFKILLQNGEQQYFFVRDKQKNEPVTPCYYFNVLFEEKFESFSDLPSQRQQPRPSPSEPGFSHQPMEVPGIEIDTLSQSVLNKFFRCPRAYLFDRLLPTFDNRYLQRGKLYHEFAEFYLNHPDLVKSEGLGTFTRLMLENMRLFVSPVEEEKLLSEFKIGLQNIIEYLDQHGLPNHHEQQMKSRDADDGREDKNIFAAEFDCELESSEAEVPFYAPELGVKGKIDLVQSETHLLDYKSGRKQTLGSLVRRANLRLFRNEVDFQAILYLCYYRRQHPDERLQFTFFYFLDNLADVVKGGGELGDTIVTVNYYPVTFPEQVPRKETFETLTGGVSESHDRRKTLEKLGFPAYNEFFRNNHFPQLLEKEALQETELFEQFEAYCVDRVGDHSYVHKGTAKTFSKLINFRRNNFFREDLDEFEEFIQTNLERINNYSRERFPVEGGIEDYDLDELSNRDLLVTGSHGP